MIDLEQRIVSTLDDIVSAAPPPVPVDDIASRLRTDASRSQRRRPVLILAVAAVVVVSLGLVGVVVDDRSTPAPPTELDTVDRGADGTDRVPRNTTRPADIRFEVVEGGWVSEIVPDVAAQLGGIDEERLWLALESMEPERPYATTERILQSAGVADLPAGRLRWEGLLLPSAHTVGPDAEPADLVRVMHHEFIRVTDELGYRRAFQHVGHTPYDVVIVASLVEAEARSDDDRAKVARVIYNRLADGLPLSIDSAYRYQAQDRDIEITPSLLEAPGPYGLRTAPGMPPTPIAAPGPDSLAAAIDPTPGPWLFYSPADDQGRLLFATTLDEHQANLELARRRGLFD